MKTQLEKKLSKLPAFIEDDYQGCAVYELKIRKTAENNHWFVEYTDRFSNSLLIVEHSSLQAAVDNTLSSLKKNRKWKRYQLIL